MKPSDILESELARRILAYRARHETTRDSWLLQPEDGFGSDDIIEIAGWLDTLARVGRDE